MSEGALTDLLVLDRSSGAAGSCCARWCADLGARVIKIEPPGGAPLRHEGPFAGNNPDIETGARHLYLDAGKRSLCIDLERETGRDLFLRLVAKADVLVEDTPQGSATALGMEWEQLAKANERLILLSITPFGRTGPYRDDPATELTLSALSGTLAVRSVSGERPVNMGYAQGDQIAGRVAVIALLGALAERDRSGKGQSIDFSMLEAITGNDMAATTTYSYTGIALVPPQRPSARGAGGQGRYPCKDGFVDVLPGIGGMKKLATMIGDPALADHELFRNHTLRAQKADEFDRTFMEPYFSTRTRAEIVEAAQALGMPFSYVLTPEELLEEPHLVERGYFVNLDHPGAKPIPIPGAPVRMTLTPPVIGPVPRLGADTGAVLQQWLGLSEEEIDRLRRQEGV